MKIKLMGILSRIKSLLLLIIATSFCNIPSAASSSYTNQGPPYVSGKIILPNNSEMAIPQLADQNKNYDCTSRTILCVPSEFKSIQSAANSVNPGDTVVVSQGDYESFVIERGGTSDKPVTFIAKKGAVISRYTDSDYGIVIRSEFTRKRYVDNVHLIGFRIESPVKRCIYFTKAISKRPTVGHVINKITCSNPGTDGFYLSQVSNTLVSDNLIINSGNGGSSATRNHGVYLSNGGTGNIILYNNVISGSSTNGVHCNGDMTVDYLENGTRGGINGTDGLISGLIFDSNIIMTNGQSGINLDGVQESLFINNVVYNNVRHGIRGYSIDSYAGPSKLMFVNNTFVNNQSAIKLSDVGDDFVIFNNFFARNSDEEIIVTGGGYSQSNNVINDSIEFVAVGDNIAVHDVDFHLSVRDKNYVHDKGIKEFNNINAPAYDLDNSLRRGLPDVGALEHY